MVIKNTMGEMSEVLLKATHGDDTLLCAAPPLRALTSPKSESTERVPKQHRQQWCTVICGVQLECR